MLIVDDKPDDMHRAYARDGGGGDRTINESGEIAVDRVPREVLPNLQPTTSTCPKMIAGTKALRE